MLLNVEIDLYSSYNKYAINLMILTIQLAVF